MSDIQHEYEKLSGKCLLSLPEEVASKINNSISVENFELEQYKRDQAENDSVNFNHSANLVFKIEEGNEVEEIELNGQMTVVDTEDRYQMSRSHDNKKTGRDVAASIF